MNLARQIADWKDKYEAEAGALPRFLCLHPCDLPAFTADLSKLSGVHRSIKIGDMVLGMRVATAANIKPGMMYLTEHEMSELPEGVKTE